MIKKIDDVINKLKFFDLMIVTVFCNLLFSSIASFTSNLLTGNPLNNGVKGFLNCKEEFILVVIVAPILETLIFQYLIINFFLTKTKSFYACVISSLIFALQHMYNLFYFVLTLFVGLIFAYLYVIGKKRNYGFILVAVAHSLYNLIVFILKTIS